jgi:uncharacterized membrane protein YdjX (TVP38/TMEM64 family)
MTRGAVARWLVAAGLLGAIAWALPTLGHLDLATLEGRLRATGGWAPLGFVLLYAAGTVLFLPGSLFVFVGGVLFGPVWGSVLNLSAAALAFLIARHVAAAWGGAADRRAAEAGRRRHRGGRLAVHRPGPAGPAVPL